MSFGSCFSRALVTAILVTGCGPAPLVAPSSPVTARTTSNETLRAAFLKTFTVSTHPNEDGTFTIMRPVQVTRAEELSPSMVRFEIVEEVIVAWGLPNPHNGPANRVTLRGTIRQDGTMFVGLTFDTAGGDTLTKSTCGLIKTVAGLPGA